MNFGWLNDKSVYKANSIEIKPLASIDNAISEVTNSSQHDGIWYYPPIVYKTNKSSPRVVTDRFELSLTHQIVQINQTQDQEFLKFMIVFFGWLNGVRLNPVGWGNLIKTPIKQGELSDFSKPKHSDVIKNLNKAEVFWNAHQQDNLANLMLGALNWYSFTQSYERIFERFMGQYSVFDTLYRIVAIKLGLTKDVSHSKRFCYVSNNLQLVCPSWAQFKNNDTEISIIRNALIHESMFAGQPVGFTASSDQSDILLDLMAFNCKVIAALIGAEGQYTRASCETKQLQAFDID